MTDFPRAVMLFAILLLAVGPVKSRAQRDAKTIQPDRVDFGLVRVGSTVEGSIRVLADRARLKVTGPKSVKAEVLEEKAGRLGGEGGKTWCEIGISIDTSQAANVDEELTIEVADGQVAVPVMAVVKERRGQRRLLVVETPFDSTSTSDASLFDPWRKLVGDADLDVSYLLVDRDKPVLRELDLSPYDTILLGEGGVYWAKEKDIGRLKDYLLDGGRLVVTANRFFRETPARANKITAKYGLEMLDIEDGREISVGVTPPGIVPHPLTKDVRRLNFFRPSPISTRDAMNAKILVSAVHTDGAGLVAVARAGKGEVIMLGQSLWWNWISHSRAGTSQNAVLLRNLLTLPASQSADDTSTRKKGP